jgi:glycine C-acetyltransferase/8-amino-7-oxononanoate synthase
MEGSLREVWSDRRAMSDLTSVLAELRRTGLYRQLRVIDSATGPRVDIDGASVILLCSNDYLGLAGHPEIRACAARAVEQWGAGAGASRLVCGNLGLHAELEAELARFKRHPRCVLFGSGYLANLGVITALVGRGDAVLSDSLNHASIVDGCRLSRAETIVYEHGDLDALRWCLSRVRARRSLIVTDGVFSMDGDLAPLEGIVELARRYGARVMVDEAHATGVIGPGGRGLVAARGLESDIDIVVGTLSKALGSYGAFVCCHAEAAEFLINRARTLIYSTALPPPSAAAALAGLKLLQNETGILERLRANARLLRTELARRGLEVEDGEIPIVPLIVGDPEVALELSDSALRGGVFAQAIRPPTVPPGTARLRLVATAAHTPNELRHAAAVIAEGYWSSARKRVSSSSSME